MCSRSPGGGIKRRAGAWIAGAAAALAAILLLPLSAHALRTSTEGSPDRVQVRLIWNREYLSLGAKVPDAMLTGSSLAPMSAPQEDDAIEFCFEVPTATGAVAHRLAVSAAGGMTVLKRDARGSWRAEPSWVSGPRTLKCSTVAEGTINDPTDRDVGFTVECAIPWEFLTGGGPPENQEIGFDVVHWMQGENQGIVGWSSNPGSGQQVGDAARWGRMLVSLSSAPAVAVGRQVVCPFGGYTPFIDGSLAPEEWMTASTLTFEKPEPTVLPTPAEKPGPAAVPLILAVYRYDWEGDPLRPGGAKLWRADGLPATINQPKEACGPWYSYRWVSWHRDQLREMQRAGIDVLLARYRGDREARESWAVTGLDRLTQALKEVRAKGSSYPLVGMLLDTAPLNDVDLTSDAGKTLIYGMIRDFFLHVPAEYRAQLAAAPEKGELGGVPVMLGEPDGLADWDEGFLNFCNKSFARDFAGARIAWLGSAAWQARGVDSFTSYVRLAGKAGLTQEGAGGASALSTAPGYCLAGTSGEVRSRGEGRAYRADWQRLSAARPYLVVINSWNDFSLATDIAPSRQYGYTYVDATRYLKSRMGAGESISLRMKQAAVPPLLAPGVDYQVEFLVENTGTEDVRTERVVTADYRIVRKDTGEVVREQVAAQALHVMPGQTRRLPVMIPTKDSAGRPLPSGDYLFTLVVVRSRVAYLRSKLFATPVAEMTVPIVVGEPPARRATVISTSLPCSMESGGSEPVVVRLRNDGSAPWRVGSTKLSYHWLRHSDGFAIRPEEADKTVARAGTLADLPRDVAPGEMVSVMIAVSAKGIEGEPLPASDAAGSWHYRLAWDLVEGADGWFSDEQGFTCEEAIQLSARDSGVLLKSGAVPAQMAAEATFEATVVVSNEGQRRWLASEGEATYLTYHWYRWDGRPANFESTVTRLPHDIGPGETVELKAQVRAPSVAGSYWLVWDMVCAGAGASGRGGGRRIELLVSPVAVSGGKFRPVDLSSAVDVAAIAADSYRAQGDFDGRGRSLPAEALAPDLSGAPQALYPSGYYAEWTEQAVPLTFPETSSGVGGAVACDGQSLVLSKSGAKRVFLLAASAGAPRRPEFVLTTAAGEQERIVGTSVPSWNSRQEGVALGAYAPYIRTISQDDAGEGAYLYLLTLSPSSGQAVSLRLPRDPATRILAVTVEED